MSERELSDALTTLSQALDNPSADLVALVERLAQSARDAVESFTRLSVSVTGEGEPFGFTWSLAPDGVRGEARASIAISRPGASTTASIILLATTPGAFVDLAADVALLSGQPLSAVEVDRHLASLPRMTTAADLAAASRMNQAVGVLIARGHSPEEARAALEERATANGVPPAVVADMLLADLEARG